MVLLVSAMIVFGLVSSNSVAGLYLIAPASVRSILGLRIKRYDVSKERVLFLVTCHSVISL